MVSGNNRSLLFSLTFGVDARLFYLLRTGHSTEHERLPVLGVVAARPVELPVRGGQGQLAAAAAAAADAVEIAAAAVAPAGGRRRRGTLCQAATFGCRKKAKESVIVLLPRKLLFPDSLSFVVVFFPPPIPISLVPTQTLLPALFVYPVPPWSSYPDCMSFPAFSLSWFVSSLRQERR